MTRIPTSLDQFERKRQVPSHSTSCTRNTEYRIHVTMYPSPYHAFNDVTQGCYLSMVGNTFSRSYRSHHVWLHVRLQSCTSKALAWTVKTGRHARNQICPILGGPILRRLSCENQPISRVSHQSRILVSSMWVTTADCLRKCKWLLQQLCSVCSALYLWVSYAQEDVVVFMRWKK